MKKPLIIVACVLVFSALATPIYYVFSQAGVKPPKKSGYAADRKARKILIHFKAMSSSGMPVSFAPLASKISVAPGQRVEVFYHAENKSGRLLSVRFMPMITPKEAAKYVIKSDCYSLPDQTLYKGELVDLPLSFHVSTKIPHFIQDITIKYLLVPGKTDHSGERYRRVI